MLPEIEPDYWRGKRIDEMDVPELRTALRRTFVRLTQEQNENIRLLKHISWHCKNAEIDWFIVCMLCLTSFSFGTVLGGFL